MSKRIDFSEALSAHSIEKGLRRDPVSFLQWLYGTERVEILSDEIRTGNKGSLALYLSDFHWHSYETGDHGVGLIAIAYTQWGIEFKATLKRCSEYLKNKKKNPKPHNAVVVRKRTPEQQEKAKERRRQRALDIIRYSLPIAGTLAERYLRNRHIPLAKLPEETIGQIGFSGWEYHIESDKKWPMLFAIVRNYMGDPVAVIRIFLAKNGKTKAPIIPQKKTLGATSGASVWLTHRRKWLILTEGLEDGLSIMIGLKGNPNYGVWCGIGGSVTTIIIPEFTVRYVVLAFDNDAAGRKYIKKLAPRLKAEGFRVFVAIPTHGKDFNEMLCRYGRLFNINMIEEYHD